MSNEQQSAAWEVLTRRVDDLRLRVEVLEAARGDGASDAPDTCKATQVEPFVPWAHECRADSGHTEPQHTCACGRQWTDPEPVFPGACAYGCHDDPEPVPKWRRMVDEVALSGTFAYPLAVVLRDIAYLDEAEDKRSTLARIIAICEQQVGDGWQADPGVDHNVWTAWGMLRELALHTGVGGPRAHDWECLARAAAGWLARLTEDGDA